ncbi:PTS sugar transporter subunit IIA, partial [Escherichia coli]|nr:PTS sugar transporter subunit IIA [Escherichia coli]
LAATDSNSHVDAISKLAELFMNEEHVEAICNAQSKEDVLAIIDKY